MDKDRSVQTTFHIQDEFRRRAASLEDELRAAGQDMRKARAEVLAAKAEVVRSEQADPSIKLSEARQNAIEWRAAAETARTSERRAKDELVECRKKCNQGLIRMDELMSDTQRLALSLTEHQSLSK